MFLHVALMLILSTGCFAENSTLSDDVAQTRQNSTWYGDFNQTKPIEIQHLNGTSANISIASKASSKEQNVTINSLSKDETKTNSTNDIIKAFSNFTLTNSSLINETDNGVETVDNSSGDNVNLNGNPLNQTVAEYTGDNNLNETMEGVKQTISGEKVESESPESESAIFGNLMDQTDVVSIKNIHKLFKPLTRNQISSPYIYASEPKQGWKELHNPKSFRSKPTSFSNSQQQGEKNIMIQESQNKKPNYNKKKLTHKQRKNKSHQISYFQPTMKWLPLCCRDSLVAPFFTYNLHIIPPPCCRFNRHSIVLPHCCKYFEDPDDIAAKGDPESD
ncbi:uncharacterized protein [Clytia hemisphaerica]|uniref:Cnidarian restricted protein n=1 Tax=Clytia hemisphaerica TaxID=252671 RepID=A0A7M5UPU0_9CNID|eukprot:TCONS_00066134-protein